MTLEEQERRAYVAGDTERAALLAIAVDADVLAQGFDDLDEDGEVDASVTDDVWAASYALTLASYGPALCGPEPENLW